MKLLFIVNARLVFRKKEPKKSAVQSAIVIIPYKMSMQMNTIIRFRCVMQKKLNENWGFYGNSLIVKLGIEKLPTFQKNRNFSIFIIRSILGGSTQVRISFHDQILTDKFALALSLSISSNQAQHILVFTSKFSLKKFLPTFIIQGNCYSWIFV